MEVKSPLYGEQTKLSLTNMSFSENRLLRFPIYIKAAAYVKKACALANLRGGLLDQDIADKICAACDIIISGKHLNSFVADVYSGGGGIAINTNINEVIANLAGPGISAANHVNMSQSTSDVCHTSLRLALSNTLKYLEEGLGLIATSLTKKGKEFEDVTTIARTCWQDGMQVSAGAVFAATASAIKRQRVLFSHYRRQLTEINLGGTVIGTGTGANVAYREHILQALCEVFDYDFTYRDDKNDSSQYPDDIAALSSAIRRTSEILAKFAKDLRFLSSGPETGLGEITLPHVQAGSTFFPGKSNPIIPETVIQCSMLVAGNDSIVQQCVGMGEIHLNIWEPMMGFLLLENINMLVRISDPFVNKCIKYIQINKETCEAHANTTMPLLLKYKEIYGYDYMAQKVKEEGIDKVMEKIRQEEKEKEKKKCQHLNQD